MKSKTYNHIYFTQISIFIITLYSFILLTSCQKELDEITVNPFPKNDEQSIVIQGLADIEFAIISDWVTGTTALQNSVNIFSKNPNTVNLTTVRTSWKVARNPWESNESFGFGPVGDDGIDGASDDWPFDITAFTQILASNITLNEAYITQMATSTKGFHAIEYLLFGTNGNKAANTFTTRELKLLELLSNDLKKQSEILKSRWMKGSKNSFYDNFVKAGEASSSYKKTSDALGEVVGSMVNIMTELPDTKIEKPLTKKDNNYAESRFADYSFNDYRSNISGVYAVYIGKYGNVNATKSISDLVLATNPKIDEKIRTQFKLCLALIDVLQTSTTFNQAILNKPEQLKDLQKEIQKINQILDSEVKVVLGL